jgi:hypothetical protein
MADANSGGHPPSLESPERRFTSGETGPGLHPSLSLLYPGLCFSTHFHAIHAFQSASKSLIPLIFPRSFD